MRSILFFSTEPSTTEIYTLSLHDALLIWPAAGCGSAARRTSWVLHRDGDVGSRSLAGRGGRAGSGCPRPHPDGARSEEHTSELQSQFHLVCRLLLEKKKKKKTENTNNNIS